MCGATSDVRFTPESDIRCVFSDVRYGPKADIALLDHLISAGEWQGGMLRPSDFAVLMFDNELELCRLNDRQVGRLFTAENAANINPCFTVGVSLIWSAAQKSHPPKANSRELNMVGSA